MLITVFTPTYNRAYILNKLYESLIDQTDKFFEWVVLNDGSIDNTDELVNKWIKEKKIKIKYIKTVNGGKQRAINYGVKEAIGELFFIVDSDDYLRYDAIESVKADWEILSGEKAVVSGLCYKKVIYTTNKIIGVDYPEPAINASLLSMKYQYKVKGDMAQIFQTKLLREYPFPEIEGETFVPEAYIWNRITDKRPMRFINNGIYFCEYLEDGLSANFLRNLKKNPKGFKLYYHDVLNYKIIPIKDKLKAIIRIIQCCIFVKINYYATKLFKIAGLVIIIY